MSERQWQTSNSQRDEKIETLRANTGPRGVDMNRPDQLPARAQRATELTPRELGSMRHCSASSIQVALLMKDGTERSVEEMIVALDLSIEQIRVQLRRLSAEGPGQLLHVSHVEASTGRQIYAYGPGKERRPRAEYAAQIRGGQA